MVPFINEAQIRAVLRPAELIPAMRRALAEFSAGRVAMPARQVLPVPEHGGHFLAMPAAGAAVGMGAKLVTVYPGNAARGLPTHLAVIVLFRPETGEPLALLDGRLITELRTAATSAVATDALAPREARVLAVLGTGVQAHAHIEALRLVRDFREVRIWGRTPAHAARLAAETGAVAALSAEAAVYGADVVVTATAATEPVLRGAWLKPGAQVNAIGWSGPAGRELDDAAMRQGVVIADTREGVQREAGDVILSGAPIHAELGEVLAGARSVPAGATIVFKSVGMAVEDVAAARLVYERLNCAA